jgi:hypothetical protein
MNKKIIVILLFFFLLTSYVLPVDAWTNTENFDDDTTGNSPTGSWYTYSGGAIVGTTKPYSSPKDLQESIFFTSNGIFDIDSSKTVSNITYVNFTLCMHDASTNQIFFSLYNGSTCLFDIKFFHYNATVWSMNVSNGGSYLPWLPNLCSCSYGGLLYNQYYNFSFKIDTSSYVYSILVWEVCGVTYYSAGYNNRAFKSNQNQYTRIYFKYLGSLGNAYWYLDNLEWEGYTPPSPPVLSNENPTNGTIDTILDFNWSVTITDDSIFNWTIECNNSDSSGANGDTNGIKILPLTGLSLNTTYTIWVNATDGIDWTRKWYEFTTVLILVNTTTEVLPITPNALMTRYIPLSIQWNTSYGIKNITVYYRYSEDNVTWGSWKIGKTIIDPWTNNPYITTFDIYNSTYPYGKGYYEFYSIGTDNASYTEPTNRMNSSTDPNLLWDFNYDGIVSVTDSSGAMPDTIQNHYGESGAPGWIICDCNLGTPFNGDGTIDWLDVSAFAGSAPLGYTALAIPDANCSSFPNYPPILGTPNPTNGSTNNSLAVNWSNSYNDVEGDQIQWRIKVYDGYGTWFYDDYHWAFPPKTFYALLPGLNTTTTYTVNVSLYDAWANDTQWVNASYTFTTLNVSGSFAYWWDTNWLAKKLVRFDVNETEADELQVLLRIQQSDYLAFDNLTSFPPVISLNSSNLGECRFIATYWDTATSTWGGTELSYYVEVDSDKYAPVHIPEQVGPTWMNIWIKLPSSIDGTKQYNRTAGDLWIYYKNMNYYPYDLSASALTLSPSGNDTFNWFCGFNEWANETEWTEHHSGNDWWVTRPVTGFKTTDKRLRFFQYMNGFGNAVGTNHYAEMFYVASSENLFSLEKLAFRISSNTASPNMKYFMTGIVSATPFTISSLTIPHDLSNPYYFYDLLWYHNDTIEANVNDYMGTPLAGLSWTSSFEETDINYLGFLLHTDVFWWGYKYTWDDNGFRERIWDTAGTANIDAFYYYIGLCKYIGREPDVLSTLLIELPYAVINYPADGSTDISLYPTFNVTIYGGLGGVVVTQWYIEPSTLPGYYGWVQDNATTIGEPIYYNDSNIINKYDYLYHWYLKLNYDYGSYTRYFSFRTEFAITANFTYNVSGKQVTFHDTSTGAINNNTHWFWDFGDGYTSEERNPVHYFYANSNFTVTLTVEELTMHWIDSESKIIDLYVAPVPETYIMDFDWFNFFIPMIAILVIIMLFIVLFAMIKRSGGSKRWK